MTEKKDSIYAVNMHGYETDKKIKIPPGISLVMYCYSGELLYVYEDLNKFIWTELFLNEEIKNYSDLISNMNRNFKFREHFCVYKEGEIVNNILFTTDAGFRDGIFQLPIQAAVHDGEETVVVSTESLFPVVAKSKWNMDFRRIFFDKELASDLVSYKGFETKIFSNWKVPLKMTSLKRIFQEFEAMKKTGTIVLLTCREGEKGERGKNTILLEGKRLKNKS